MVMVCNKHTGMYCPIVLLCCVIIGRFNYSTECCAQRIPRSDDDFICSDTCESVDHSVRSGEQRLRGPGQHCTNLILATIEEMVMRASDR